MKVLILAAGVGTRISRHLHGQPKCCIDIGGKPLIQRTLDRLIEAKIDDIAIVTGYQERHIHQALEGYRYTRYFNPFFRVANSVSSVWFARDFLSAEDDLMIMNGDVFFERGILDTVIALRESPVMLADSTRISDADYRFTWEGSRLTNYGKELSNAETTGEYVGIGKLDCKDIGKFRQEIVDHVVRGDYACWWEDAVYRTIKDDGLVHVRDIAGLFWAEVDYIEDYERIREFMAKE